MSISKEITWIFVFAAPHYTILMPVLVKRGTMLHMIPETMTGIHVTLFNLVTMTDKMFSSSYITASTDVIVLAADLLLRSTQLLSSVASGSEPLGHD